MTQDRPCNRTGLPSRTCALLLAVAKPATLLLPPDRGRMRAIRAVGATTRTANALCAQTWSPLSHIVDKVRHPHGYHVTFLQLHFLTKHKHVEGAGIASAPRGGRAGRAGGEDDVCGRMQAAGAGA